MGRAIRWLRSLLVGKKEPKEQKEYEEYTGYGCFDRREKKRWSFARSTRDSGHEVADDENPKWLNQEQSKHAIAVAAATAAAADAALAAAHAAAAVVRLTSQGRGGSKFAGAHEQFAAVKIQTAFRAYLAKKALRALKALVKLQALVRGYLVRKKAAATLYSMQALVRAQATVRAQRYRNLAPPPSDQKTHPEFHHRRSLQERYEFDRSPKIVEMDTCRPRSRSSRRTSSPSVLDPMEELIQYPTSTPSPIPAPARISLPDCRKFQDYDWWASGCRLSATAQSTPRYMNCPNYMTSTQSFEAKVRSQSAPRQRPEAATSTPAVKRLPLSEVAVESRASLSCIRMQVNENFDFKRAVVNRLDRSLDLCKEYSERKW